MGAWQRTEARAQVMMMMMMMMMIQLCTALSIFLAESWDVIGLSLFWLLKLGSTQFQGAGGAANHRGAGHGRRDASEATGQSQQPAVARRQSKRKRSTTASRLLQQGSTSEHE